MLWARSNGNCSFSNFPHLARYFSIRWSQIYSISKLLLYKKDIVHLQICIKASLISYRYLVEDKILHHSIQKILIFKWHRLSSQTLFLAFFPFWEESLQLHSSREKASRNRFIAKLNPTKVTSLFFRKISSREK